VELPLQDYMVVNFFIQKNNTIQSVKWRFYTVSQKNIPDVFSYNSQKHCRIFIIFGRNITKKASN